MDDDVDGGLNDDGDDDDEQVDQLHEDGRDGRAHRQDRVLIVSDSDHDGGGDDDDEQVYQLCDFKRFERAMPQMELPQMREHISRFDGSGFRTNFTLEIVELKRDGLQKVCFSTFDRS